MGPACGRERHGIPAAGGGKAADPGDCVLAADELNFVIQTQRSNGFEVTQRPRLFFMHFWAHDDALKPARGLRAERKERRRYSS